MKTTARTLLRYFLSGTIFIVPLVATLYFIFAAITWLDGLLETPIPGLGLVIIISVITLFGYLTTTFFFKTFTDLFETAIKRMPLVSLIYNSIKDLIGAFVGDKKKFTHPVLVLMNKESGIYKMGFVTQDNLNEIGLKDMVSVYLPHSYNFSGNHFLVPRENIKPLNIPGATAMKFIVSGGISGFDE
ncbi:MAG TPA: DUF502 domain-containing protein [Cyclobacteriaceae bacterium]|nr:DUF502 domain-containing protein [Cyclobacteriaceae bacterium]